MTSKLLTLLLLAGITSVFLYSTSHQKHAIKFDEWASSNGKTYESDVERVYREKIFSDNLVTIEKHNADPAQTYKKGVNQFTDLTDSEFATQYLTLKINKKFEKVEITESLKPFSSKLLGDVDWV